MRIEWIEWEYLDDSLWPCMDGIPRIIDETKTTECGEKMAEFEEIKTAASELNPNLDKKERNHEENTKIHECVEIMSEPEEIKIAASELNPNLDEKERNHEENT